MANLSWNVCKPIWEDPAADTTIHANKIEKNEVNEAAKLIRPYTYLGIK